MKEVVIARVVHNLLNECGLYCDVRSVGRRVQIVLYVRVICMSVRGTFVQGMINIIWRKYAHIRTSMYSKQNPIFRVLSLSLLHHLTLLIIHPL